ncbi:hypothetical protein HQ325_02640 [Rhodococcus sp. BP-349]|uniref:hypothetical protein n=1 Tax=unclassified Rhodococcus (in: high G+C Gram-positive bacteria) TaxID=192944 RepID=UPI001C9B61E0|nr:MULTISPECIES: hypothetical protein [unclassified Rhodococcus (in: high G+C Gram-positive bacteria)]MBY6537561.1 hypothetical protein [Rhodococcus sp. BP-363]MBY6541898.1 hypothetical protein [Rhodococcus sp. BP-369]MBY6561128.1 hypothetical protein [Rhodococcus sp. BP-370]MBY6575420.1 hypothetical protein [Rhodococcus sp. BP-364]MBY6584721.1 hypothetical protein [Rhodococcus sp. BP-358]
MSARSQGFDSPQFDTTIHLVMALTDAETAVSVDIDGGTELFECATAVRLDPDGRVRLDDSHQGVRGFLYAVGDPRGLGMADGRVVRAEDLVAGFVHALTAMVSELYSLPADARCTLLHPAGLSADSIAALRDALDYVGLDHCSVSPATSEDPATAVRAAAPHRSSPSTSAASDKAFAAMVSDSATGRTGRTRTHRRTPTRAAVSVAAVALAFLAVGGAVGTRDLDSSSVAPLNSQQAITPSAPVVTSPLESTTTSSAPPPVEEQAPAQAEEIPAPEIDTPDPVVPPAPPTAAAGPSTGLGLPTDRFPFAPPDIDFPEFPSFPEVTPPTVVTSPPATTTSSAVVTPASTTPSDAASRFGRPLPVNPR